MDIREIVKRLEELETQARDKRHYELEDSIGRLIEDIIEDDIEQERQFRKEVSKSSSFWLNSTSVGVI